MLDTQFERVIGDIGNPDTFGFPVIYRRVAQARVDAVVSQAHQMEALIPAFVQAAKELEAEGVFGITTSCGFLSLAQDQISAAVSVPVLTSSLLLVAKLAEAYPGQTIGIATADSDSLSDAHLRAAGIPAACKVKLIGMQNGAAFENTILKDPNPPVRPLDQAAIQAELLTACQQALQDTPDIAAFVLECSNLQPYAEALNFQTKRPVFGLNDVIAMLRHDHGLSSPDRV